jgi:hypothetical protein
MPGILGCLGALDIYAIFGQLNRVGLTTIHLALVGSGLRNTLCANLR